MLTTTNMALLGPTLNMPNAETISATTSITTICTGKSTDVAITPIISAEPQSQTIANGQTATLSVLVTGTPPIHYQWYQGASGLESTPVGTDSSTFVTPPLATTTKYWVKISNSNGQVNSATAIVTVENTKWLQATWPDYKQSAFNLTLAFDGTLLVTTQDVITRFGPNDWPCSSPPGFLYALEPGISAIKWSIDLGHSAPPAVAANGTIYTNRENRLYGVDPANGAMTLIYTAGRNFTSSPAIAADGTIFIGAGQNVLAINPGTRQLIWEAPTDKFVIQHPTIGSDGTVYGGSDSHNGVFAIEGTSGGIITGHWPCFGHDPQHSCRHDDSFVGIPPTITIQPENKLIKSGETATFTVSATGDAVLSYQWYQGIMGDQSNPVGQNATEYTTPPLTQMNNYWVQVENAFGKDMSNTVMASTGKEGEVKWFYNTNPTFDRNQDGEIMGGIGLARDGTLYFGIADARLYAMNPDGSLAWQFPTGQNTGSSVVIGTDNSIYVAGSSYVSSAHRLNLFCLNPDGTEKWRFPKTGDPDKIAFSISTPAIGADGNIYFGIPDGAYGRGDGRLYALKADGTKLWSAAPYLGVMGDSPPVIAPDGTLYAGTGESYESDIYGFLFAVNTQAFGVANNAWPMFGHDPQRLSRMTGFPPCDVPVILIEPRDTIISFRNAVNLTVVASGTGLRYQWYKGIDRSVPVGSGESFVTPDLVETTRFWVEVSNTCGSVNSRTVTISTTLTGTPEPIAEDFSVMTYPNPATDHFIVESNGPGFDPGTVALLDLYGRIVYEARCQAGTWKMEINVSTLSRGIYFCRIQSGNRVVLRKMVKI